MSNVYLKSTEYGMKMRIDLTADKAYIKTPNGEREIPHTSKVGTDISIEDNQISEEEYKS